MKRSDSSKQGEVIVGQREGKVPAVDTSGFPATRWSDILEAADGDDPDVPRYAFEQICAVYCGAIALWMELKGLNPEDAKDATQDFLEQWLRRENPLRGFERGERRFREFLGVCLRRFLSDWRAARAAKRRGGGALHVPLETQELPQSSDRDDSSVHVDYALAADIHGKALARLETTWKSRASDSSFTRLWRVALGREANPGYPVIAAELGVPVGTVKSWISRLRREYYEAFRDAVFRLSPPCDFEDDVVYLHNLLQDPPSSVFQKKR